MSGSAMDRRLFLLRSLMAAAAGVVAPPLAGCAAGGGDTAATPEELAALMLRDDAVLRLGREYLAAHPGESDPAALAGLLAAGLPALEDAAGRQALLARIRDDYAAGRTVILSGWVLSLSEGRLCALAARAAGSQPAAAG